MEVSRLTIAWRSIRCHCPNCGHRPIFDGLRLKSTCPVCYMALQRGSGWWLGPLVINYGLVTFGLVLPFLAAGILGWIPLYWGIGGALFCGMVIPFLLYRWSWGLWNLAYYCILPHELPANNTSFDHLDKN